MKIANKTVVVDCDGVLANFVKGFCRLVATEAEAMKAATFDTYHQIAAYESTSWAGWTRELIDLAWHRVHHTPNFYYSLEPLSRAMEDSWALIKLTEQMKLYIVTARRDHYGSPMNELTQHWIEEHYNAHTSVIATASEDRKIAVIEALEPYAVIDDSPRVLGKLMASSALQRAETQIYKRGWPYNYDAEAHDDVRSLYDFARRIGVEL